MIWSENSEIDREVLFQIRWSIRRSYSSFDLSLQSADLSTMQRLLRAEGNGNVPLTNTDKQRNSTDGKSVDQRVLVTVFFSLVIDLLAFTVILPLFPSLLEYYGAHDEKVPIKFYVNGPIALCKTYFFFS